MPNQQLTKQQLTNNNNNNNNNNSNNQLLDIAGKSFCKPFRAEVLSGGVGRISRTPVVSWLRYGLSYWAIGVPGYWGVTARSVADAGSVGLHYVPYKYSMAFWWIWNSQMLYWKLGGYLPESFSVSGSFFCCCHRARRPVDPLSKTLATPQSRHGRRRVPFEPHPHVWQVCSLLVFQGRLGEILFVSYPKPSQTHKFCINQQTQNATIVSTYFSGASCSFLFFGKSITWHASNFIPRHLVCDTVLWWSNEQMRSN